MMLLATGLAFWPASVANAATFRVFPIRVDFDKQTKSALLTLSNESTEELRFQISAFVWGQNEAGEMQLTPTKDVTFYPPLLVLKPGQERKVRVGTAVPPGAVEKTYRIFFEELPGLQTSQVPAGGAQVKIITKMGVPIFVLQPRSKPFRPSMVG